MSDASDGSDLDAPGDPRDSALPLAVALAAVLGLAMTVVWALTGSGYYWPCWIWLGCLAALAPLAWWAHWRTVAPAARWFARHADVAGTAAVLLLLIWLFTGLQGPWPAWPVGALVLTVAVHALIHYRDELPLGRSQQLEERVETLTRTRRSAVDAQAAELRRIERDLHDGAQARLVALSMQLGRAEARLQDRPEVVDLIRAAREEAGAAIAELRDLARGIAPPVLADRGLVPALRSLADRSPAPVTLAAPDDLLRLPPAVEGAAYFVVAEALTNVAKHAPGASATVRLTHAYDVLLVDVADTGPGGADPEGSGLRGLAARVEALDGTLMLASPPGGPTRIRVELPCAS